MEVTNWSSLVHSTAFQEAELPTTGRVALPGPLPEEPAVRGGREGEREGRREGEREGREGGREGGKEGGREGGKEGGRARTHSAGGNTYLAFYIVVVN